MKKSLIKRLMALALVIVSVFSVAAVAFADTTKYVNVTPNVNFRKSPGGDLIDRIPYGAAVTEHSTSYSGGEEWSYVTYNKTNGYVMTKFLSPNSPSGGSSTSELGWVSIAVSSDPDAPAMLYSQPSSSSTRLANLSSVRSVSVCFDTNDFRWARCVYNGMTGYVKYIDLDPSESDFLNASYGGTNVILREGKKGQAVKNLQMQLAQLGYSTNGIDGIYGSGTKQAVTNFQKKYNLDADGIAGPNTFKKIYSVLDYYYY